MFQHDSSVHKFCHSAMGTTFEVIFADVDSDYAQQVSQAVFSEFDRLERALSRFDPSSQISIVNRLLPGQSLAVSVDVYDCLTTAFLIHDRTKGAFDINFAASGGKKSTRQGKAVETTRLKHAFLVKRPAEWPAPASLRVDLDLGGIGKGYALDKVLEILKDWSIENALIHGGTSTALAIGDAPGQTAGKRGWPVGVGGNWPVLKNFRYSLESRALSGSGTEVKGQHIIDPRTGQKASGSSAVWVSHASAAVADALSTAFLVMTPHEVAAYCEEFPDTGALVLIDPDHYEVYNDIFDKNDI